MYNRLLASMVNTHRPIYMLQVAMAVQAVASSGSKTSDTSYIFHVIPRNEKSDHKDGYLVWKSSLYESIFSELFYHYL